jgi:hypothetical protein
VTGGASRLARFGCVILCAPFLVIALPFVIAFSLWDDYRAAAFRRDFGRKWPGKRGLLVYSNSPNWQSYIEQHWLPRIGSQMVLLNWSERAMWADQAPFESAIFRRFAGDTEFNPLAIVFRTRAPHATLRTWISGIRALDPVSMVAPSPHDTLVIRFFQAFRDHKHGKDRLLRAREAELFGELGA